MNVFLNEQLLHFENNIFTINLCKIQFEYLFNVSILRGLPNKFSA